MVSGSEEKWLVLLPPVRKQARTGQSSCRDPGLSPTQDPSFLDKQARCRYLKGKLRHLKMQIRKFDEQDHSEDSVFF